MYPDETMEKLSKVMNEISRIIEVDQDCLQVVTESYMAILKPMQESVDSLMESYSKSFEPVMKAMAKIFEIPWDSISIPKVPTPDIDEKADKALAVAEAIEGDSKEVLAVKGSRKTMSPETKVAIILLIVQLLFEIAMRIEDRANEHRQNSEQNSAVYQSSDEIEQLSDAIGELAQAVDNLAQRANDGKSKNPV